MKYFGPSTLVSAAFIGPGTITVCTLAGVNHGYDLLFALLFSGIATIVLQEMAARVGLVTQSGLGTEIRENKKKSKVGQLLFLLVAAAILFGNAAYEAGNITGGNMGLELIINHGSISSIFIGLIAFALLFFGSYKQIEGFLIAMVICMSIGFFVTMLLLKPSINDVLSAFIPKFSLQTDWKNIAALVGTTVVPYNLFLQSSLISKKYSKVADLNDLRKENMVAIGLGTLVSMMIVIVAASNKEATQIKSPIDLAIQLEPLLGNWANLGTGIGLFAAGLSSAITAPLAAALLARELFDWPKNETNWKFKATWMFVLAIGILISSFKINAITLIQGAQWLNGILLPIIAAYLLFVVNKKQLLGKYVNSKWQNFLGFFVVLICIILSIRTVSLLLF
ncbi:NRAMP (natural resistance-associated macrophage protein) metal ion transporters [Spirosomataceae bacterium TFI 002]|nr:NRAMP (natural resistance-associated macrophage protein) metal ion transporters [Spirosomataceae bacterium TFI 002]